VNGHVFINNSSIGLYPAIVQERSDRQSRGYSKWVAFFQAVYTVLRRCPSFHATLHADGASKGGDHTPFVFVGNNRYETSGLRIGERGTLRAGRLWVCRAPGADRAVLLRMALQAALGHPAPGELKVLEAEELWVKSRRSRLKVANDGEVQSFTSPLHYRILPGALRVIVPPRAGQDA
jgi:diacylglycerol kinase family enzyme